MVYSPPCTTAEEKTADHPFAPPWKRPWRSSSSCPPHTIMCILQQSQSSRVRSVSGVRHGSRIRKEET